MGKQFCVQFHNEIVNVVFMKKTTSVTPAWKIQLLLQRLHMYDLEMSSSANQRSFAFIFSQFN
jgi:hypothetical protein